MRSFVGFCLFTVLLLGCSNPNESANKLFVDATALLQDSFTKEAIDPVAAVESSETALSKIAEIIHSYPSSDLAVKLVQGQTIFNKLSVKALQDRQERLQTMAKVVRDVTESPLSVALWLAEKQCAIFSLTYLVESGRIKQALQVVNARNSDIIKAQALETIAIALAKAGDPQQAIQIANTIGEDSTRAAALERIAIIPTDATEIKASAVAVNTKQALQVANAKDYDSGKVLALCEIASSLAKAGDIKQAQAVCKQALQVADGMTNVLIDDKKPEKQEALVLIICALLDAGDTKQAIQIINANEYCKTHVSRYLEKFSLFEIKDNGQRIPIKTFSKEQQQLARMVIYYCLNQRT